MVDSQGPNSGTVFADDATVGTVAWTNYGNVVASDDACAYFGAAYAATSHYLKVTGFGFTIPVGASIVGVVVGIERRSALTHTSDSSVKLIVGGVIAGTDKATATAWPVVDTYEDHGGVGDLWGYTLSASLVNSPDFGVAVSAIQSSNEANFVDHIRITIYYNMQNDPEAPIPASSPYMPLFASPWFQAYTYATTFSSILNFQVRLGANGSMGSFAFTVPDPIGLEFNKVTRNDRVVMLLRQGPVERRYTGIIETCEKIDNGRDLPRSRLSGRGYAVYLSRRNNPADYTNRPIYDIITNTSDGLASVVSELDFVNYVRSPGVTISTSSRRRSCLNVLNELMIRSGSATEPWTFYVCHQNHIYETKEAVHFLQKSYAPTPIVITYTDVMRSERISTMQFLQNQIEVEYGTVGATETRNDTNSQNTYGIIYNYTYAPFLAADVGAQDWGDKWLYRSKNELKAVSLTVPMNLFIEPNTTLRYCDATSDQVYDVGMVMHQGSNNGFECQTTVEAATTL